MEAETQAQKVDRMHLELRRLEQEWEAERRGFLGRYGEEPVDTFKGRYLVAFILLTLLLSALPILSFGEAGFPRNLILSLGGFLWLGFWLVYGRIRYHQFLEARAKHEAACARLEQKLAELRAGEAQYD
ncbi:MAG: hypothetical protein RL095_15 [Verrucomicrobiota bacterium]|jgi:hypothetical protein